MSLTPAQALARVAELESALAVRDRQVDELSRAVETAQGTITKLQHQMDQLLKRLYGRSSEKLDPNQMLFDAVLIPALDSAPAAEEAPEPPPAAAPASAKPRLKGHGRLPIPDHLTRVEVIVEVPEEDRVCRVTGEPMVCIGYEISAKLEFEPGRLFVRVYKRPKYVSPERHNGTTGVVTAAMPDHPISRCKADVGLWAWVVGGNVDDELQWGPVLSPSRPDHTRRSTPRPPPTPAGPPYAYIAPEPAGASGRLIVEHPRLRTRHVIRHLRETGDLKPGGPSASSLCPDRCSHSAGAWCT